MPIFLVIVTIIVNYPTLINVNACVLCWFFDAVVQCCPAWQLAVRLCMWICVGCVW